MTAEKERMRAILAALPDPVFILTESGRYAEVIGGTDPRYYHDGSGLVGHTLGEVLPKEKADWFLAQIRHALELQQLCTIEYALGGHDVQGLDPDKGPAGELWFEGRIQPLAQRYDGERAVVWVARNITRRFQLEAELRRMSETDDLTGACNRRKFLEHLAEHFREFQRYGEPAALLMLDIDFFKRVNDRFGHAAGDEVLRAIVRVSAGQLREVDLFARFGGEEFIALLPHTGQAGARETAERLREAIARDVARLAKLGEPVTISIGVALLREQDDGFEQAIKRADDAMYEAKRLGRNRVVVAADME